jgi:rare lipoprotein A
MAFVCQGRRPAALLRMAAIVTGGLLLANCAASNKFFAKVDPKYGVETSPRVIAEGQPIPKGGGTYRVGKPYTVGGRSYVPEENINYRAEGMASWYGDDFHGRLTANGEIFDMNSISAAHPTLPMPSYVRVTNLANHRSIVVRVNDRGPYHGDRVIDVSVKTAKLLGFYGDGLVRVRVEYVGRAPLEGSDDRKLIATLRNGAPAQLSSPVMVASARPFVPNSRDAAWRSGIPVPPDRPFADATGAARAPSARETATDMTAISRNERVNRPSLPAVTPVSTFAAARPDPSPAFMAGRGLY